MNNFNAEYLKLLKHQVQDEIDFLRNHGHKDKFPTIPCQFCIPYENHYACSRLSTLNSFLKDVQKWQGNRNEEKFKPSHNSNLRPLLSPF